MNRLRLWIRMTLGFSRGESNAFILLLPVMMILIFGLSFYRQSVASSAEDFSIHQHYLDSVTATWEWEKKAVNIEKKFRFLHFDPNTVSQQQLESMGLNKFITQRLINYRTKGGKFFSKNDLKKLYGMDTVWFKMALPYIDLPETKNQIPLAAKPLPEYKKKETVAFNLNEADTAQLIALRGIGSKLAARIIKYRDKLGGFVNMGQLKEVYGLDTTVIAQVKEMTFIERNFVPARLNINQLTEKELAAHPYLNWKSAKAITAYRFQHGAFRSLEDLAGVKLIDAQTLQRIKPYLTLD